MSITFRTVKALLKTDYHRVVGIRPAEELTFHRITLRPNGSLTILHGYCWDHASGAFDTDSIIEGALVHDALCELIHNGLLADREWDEAAEIMREINLENDMWRIRANWICRAIKIAGPNVTEARKYITI